MKSKVAIFLLLLFSLLSADPSTVAKDPTQIKPAVQTNEAKEDPNQIKPKQTATEKSEHFSLQFTSGGLTNFKGNGWQTNFITANIFPAGKTEKYLFSAEWYKSILPTVGYGIGNSTGTLNKTALYGLTLMCSKYTGLTIGCAHNLKEDEPYFYAGLAVDLKMFTAYNLLKSLLIEE